MKNQSHDGVNGNNGFVPLRAVLDVYLGGTFGDVSYAEEPPLQSGYSDLDSLLGGMQRGDLIVLGGQTGLGKSSLALNICANAAKSGQVCGIFSPEMSREQAAMRMLVAESGVDSHRLRLGLLSEYEQNVVANTVGVLSKMPIFIDDTSSPNTMEMRSKAQRLQQEHGLDFLVVDYLQLIPGRERTRGLVLNRVQEVDEISHALKLMARELNVPVLTCSGVNRAVENRPGHRPQLSDLRDSGSIEEIADVVVLLYREDKNFTEDEWDVRLPGRPYPRNLVELIVAKHRHGPTGSFHLYFRDTLMRFDEPVYYKGSTA